MTTREKANKLHKKVKMLIITCVDSDGYPLTKAVVPGKYRESIEEIYFCTNTSSKFASEIIKNSKSSVYFYSRRLVWQGCLLKGEMQIVTDMKVKEIFWQEKFKNAYPEKSFTDPDFCLLRFVPISGRYYSWYKLEDFTC